MTKLLAKDWPALLALLVPFVLIPLFWNQIPDEIPMQWGTDGEVNKWGQKGFDVFILPLASLGAYLLMLAIPYIDPKRKTESQQKGISAFRLIIPFLLTALFLVIFAQWIGLNFDIGKGLAVVVTLFFIVMGNYLQSVRPNYFLGIRTPWTLESEDIWRKTHRIGGRLWVIGGLILLVLSFFIPTDTFFTMFSIGILVLALAPILYSFYLYMRAKKETPISDNS